MGWGKTTVFQEEKNGNESLPDQITHSKIKQLLFSMGILQKDFGPFWWEN